MKKLAIFAIALASLAGCQTAPSVDLPPGQITSASAFNQGVVGRRLSIETGFFTANADGTMTGRFNNAPLEGTWAFRGGQFCRTLTVHSTRAPTDDCQTFTVTEGGNISVEGSAGRAFTYTLG